VPLSSYLHNGMAGFILLVWDKVRSERPDLVLKYGDNLNRKKSMNIVFKIFLQYVSPHQDTPHEVNINI